MGVLGGLVFDRGYGAFCRRMRVWALCAVFLTLCLAHLFG